MLCVEAGLAGSAQGFLHVKLQAQPLGSHLTPRLGQTRGNFPSTHMLVLRKEIHCYL